MKRFGMYNDDFTNLFECYAKVGTVVERKLPSMSRTAMSVSTTPSFDNARAVKIFIQRPGQGADLAHLAKIVSVDSDDGKGGVILTCKEGDKTIQLSTTPDNAQVKVVSSSGEIENHFITTLPVRFDAESGELTVIQVEEV